MEFNPIERVHYKKVHTELVRFGESTLVPLDELGDGVITELRATMEPAVHCLRLDLLAYIRGVPKEKVSVHRKWPKDWWQAVRERWFPNRWLARWPVEYERIDLEYTASYSICPHLPKSPKETHLTWLLKQDEIAHGCNHTPN